MVKLQGTYEEVDLGSIWKYSAEGLEYYTKMYDEYIEHYKGDEKQYKEAQVNKMKYLILELEQRNLNTGERTADEMVEMIRKTIASVSDKAY